MAKTRIGFTTDFNLINSKVGIGNSIPGSFNSFANNLVVGTGTGANGITIYAGNASTSTLNFADGTSGNDLFPGYIMYNHADDSLSFIVNYAGSPPARMFISSAGNVGIGTTGPADRLVVANGNISHLLGTTSATVNTLYDADTASNTYRINVRKDGADACALAVVTQRSGGSVSEAARIDSSGRLLVGTPTARANLFRAGVSSGLQVEGVPGDNGRRMSLAYNSNDAGSPEYVFIKSRGTVLGSNTVVQNGDGIGGIYFNGTDGTSDIIGASITASVDGTPGANDMPGRLVFSTTPVGVLASPTPRMRIANNGIFTHLSDGVYNFRTAQAASGSAAGIDLTHSSTSLDNGILSFRVFTNGNTVNTNNSYLGISDIKLKENIVDANSQWDDLKALQVRNYNLKEETGQQTHTQIGLVAQEVELISPGLVSESPDRDGEGNDLGTVTKSVNYSVLYMKAVKALQEAMRRIETLEQRLTAAGID